MVIDSDSSESEDEYSNDIVGMQGYSQDDFIVPDDRDYQQSNWIKKRKRVDQEIQAGAFLRRSKRFSTSYKNREAQQLQENMLDELGI